MIDPKLHILERLANSPALAGLIQVGLGDHLGKLLVDAIPPHLLLLLLLRAGEPNPSTT